MFLNGTYTKEFDDRDNDYLLKEKFVGEFTKAESSFHFIINGHGTKFLHHINVSLVENWMIETDGEIKYEYVGEFKRGVFHGKGTRTLDDGTIETGIWEEGELIETQEEKETKKTQPKTKPKPKSKPKPKPKSKSQTKPPAPEGNMEARLSKLKELEASGLITKEEAAEKRKAILDSL